MHNYIFNLIKRKKKKTSNYNNKRRNKSKTINFFEITKKVLYKKDYIANNN